MGKINPAKLRVLPGRAYPVGSMPREGGIRFALVARHATHVWLALFENPGDAKPAHEIAFDPNRHKTGDIWSIFVEGLKPEVYYMYRVDGPWNPAQGHRYDPGQYLLDPYAKLIVGDIHEGTARCCVVVERPDWIDDHPPRVGNEDLIIYETHVRGLTVHPSACVEHGGTYLGLIEKIPYLKDLGVTAVELLPMQEFGETRLGRCSVETGEELRNYWGYSSIGFFAPTSRYAVDTGDGGPINEFRQMVAALHRAGIEVILDIVINHTSEGNEKGPTLCFRGIDNPIYYMLDEHGGYRNFSGCGNTLNCNHPLVRDFILDCLRYWVAVMHVDGFRFDLASILGRDRNGRVVQNAGLIERIAEDPVLRNTKLIAEAWDAGGAYQLGSFGDVRWAEWNGKYRDEVRRYWRGDPGLKGAFATRLSGSDDLYRDQGRTPAHSINFITCHDGFTLRDLVTYNKKHNRANGEGNRDGADENFSWNCGVEGETPAPEINQLRMRMQKSYLATLFLSMGIPMILGGDEFGRTQRGNNNAYCQDNEISWYDWRLLDVHRELFRFGQELIRFRKANPAITRMTYYEGVPPLKGGRPDLVWFDASGAPPQWEGADGLLGCRFDAMVNSGKALCILFNPTQEDAEFIVPEGRWTLRVDTAAQAPNDIVEEQAGPQVRGYSRLTVRRKALCVLLERRT